jgi:hypothetical protein
MFAFGERDGRVEVLRDRFVGRFFDPPESGRRPHGPLSNGRMLRAD